MTHVHMSWGSEDDLTVASFATVLLRLYTAFREESGKAAPEKMVPFSSNRSVCRFLAYRDQCSAAAGMATLIVRPDGLGTSSIGIVEDVYVLPEHREQGLCTLLMREVIRQAGKNGLVRLELTSNPKKPGRIAAIGVYMKLGFKREDPATGGTNLYRLKL